MGCLLYPRSFGVRTAHVIIKILPDTGTYEYRNGVRQREVRVSETNRYDRPTDSRTGVGRKQVQIILQLQTFVAVKNAGTYLRMTSACIFIKQIDQNKYKTAYFDDKGIRQREDRHPFGARSYRRRSRFIYSTRE